MLPTISTLNQYITLEIIPKTPDSPFFFLIVSDYGNKSSNTVFYSSVQCVDRGCLPGALEIF